MTEVAPEVLTNFIVKQGQIWQSVALHLSEQSGTAVEIPIPTAESAAVGEFSNLSTDTVLHARSGFVEVADEPCLFIVGEQPTEREAAERALCEAVLGNTPDALDDATLAALRDFFAHLMQGLAIAFGNLRNATFAPTEVELKRDPVVFPPNFLSVDEVIAVRLTVNLPEREPIPLTWLLTGALAAQLLGMQVQPTDPLGAFAFDEAPAAPSAAPSVQPAPMSFNPFGEMEETAPRNLDLLMDIPLEVSVELGRVTLLVSELLEIGTGSIVELKKVAGEPVEVLVNGRLIARGEVVVVEDNFAVRITEIISPMERVQRLGA
ncbi:MAG: flagellar motor switch protein FliN [Fimbriimonadales bacterium]|nr:flagellar motor switch protein FliN [Fimbriimonadales bacterium]